MFIMGVCTCYVPYCKRRHCQSILLFLKMLKFEVINIMSYCLAIIYSDLAINT